MTTRFVSHRWVYVTSVLALLVGLNFWTVVFRPSLHNVTNGFPVYYSSARLLHEGRWSNEIYGDSWFPAEVRAQTDGRVAEVFWPNPPAAALLLLPLAGMSMADAREVWLVLNLIALLLAVWLIVARLQESPAFGLGLLALALAYGPLRQNFRIGQAYPLLLLLFVVAWYGASGRRFVFAGLALGLSAAVKWQGAPLWLVLAAARRWRMLAVAVMAGAVVVAISCVLIGWPNWVGYLLMSVQTPNRGWMTSIAFQGTHNFFQHLLVTNADLNPTPLWHQPGLATTLSLAVSGATLAVTLWRARGADASLSFAAGLTLSVILSPFALDYHYALLFLPVAVMAASVLRSPRSQRDVMWLVGIVALVSAPWRHYFPALDTMASGLLGYLRLYGGWLLWLWLITRRDAGPVPGVAETL